MPGFTYLDDNGKPDMSLPTVEKYMQDETVCPACRMNMAMYAKNELRNNRNYNPLLGIAREYLDSNIGKEVSHTRDGHICFAHGWRFERVIKVERHEIHPTLLPQHAKLFKGE
jgi:hypothetical protein